MAKVSPIRAPEAEVRISLVRLEAAEEASPAEAGNIQTARWVTEATLARVEKNGQGWPDLRAVRVPE